MADYDYTLLGEEELSLYDALIKHHLAIKKRFTTHEQIDELFIEPTPIIPDPVNPGSIIPNVTFGGATEEQFADIINGYYNGTYTLEQVQSIWHIGDTRSINISSIENTGTIDNVTWTVGESHRGQEVQIEILDFNHDNLIVSQGGIGKALLTIDLKDGLRASGIEDNQGDENTENGYMNEDITNIGGWEYCARRNWCNYAFYNSLPQYLKTLVKEVSKPSSKGSDVELVNVSDYVFLLSAVEILGTEPNSMGYKSSYIIDNEGIQYNYYIDHGYNKKPNSSYWTRTSDQTTSWCFIDEGGSRANANILYGIAPAFCL